MKDSWAVVEITNKDLRIILSSLDESEAKNIAKRYNAIGDYTYEAIPIVIRTNDLSTGTLDRIYQRLSSRLR